MQSEQNKKVWVVAADMGYGHQRTAYPLKDIAFTGRVINANSYEGIPKKDYIISKFTANKIGLCTINLALKEFTWIVKPQHNQNLGHEKEYLVNSVMVPKRQIFWSRLNDKKAVCHA